VNLGFLVELWIYLNKLIDMKLNGRDKVALWVAWVIVYTIGLIPTLIAGWVAYTYRDKLKGLYDSNKEKINTLISKFK
jgi:hypothetical protein